MQVPTTVDAPTRRTRSSDRTVAFPMPAGAHLHRWMLAAVEDDEFGTVRMVRCRCGATRFDDRSVAA